MHKDDLIKLLNDLSIEEKVGQLVQLSGEFFKGQELSIGPANDLGIDETQVQYVGSALNVSGAQMTNEIQRKYLEKSRHKIPLLFMGDVVYGYKTILPNPMGLGSTWNPELIETGYRMLASEASAAGIHVTFSPMVDLVRDPRWGRVAESTGEDVFLNGQYAAAMVRGFQNDFQPKSSLAACVKHFAAYGAAEGGRDYNTVDMSRWRLMSDHLPSYKAALDAGAKMLMTSFNTIEGMPSTGNKWLLRELLRDTWNYEGVVIADYAAVAELVDHGVAENHREASRLAIEAGLDIDMKSPSYINNLQKLIADGVVEERLLDEAVLRVLTLKNELGLFEDPYRHINQDVEAQQTLTEANFETSKKTADESIVLLKNNGILPLSKDTKVGLVGPFSDAREVVGMWAINADFPSIRVLKDSLGKRMPNLKSGKGTEIVYDYSQFGGMGLMIQGMLEKHFGKPDLQRNEQEALQALEFGDVIVVAIGEHMLASGEGGSRTDLHLHQHQRDFFETVKRYGKSIVTVVYTGRPLIIDDIVEASDAVLLAWYPGTMGAESIADILVGDVNPSGRLAMSFPRNVGQIPVYYNHFSTGRPADRSGHSERFVSKYIDAPNDPYYSFGYGLSYHDCSYGQIKADKETLKGDESITLSIELTNTKNVAGLETVQVYSYDHVGSVVRPVKQLIDFKKVHINANETKTVTFEISKEHLAFVNANLETVTEPGTFTIYIGKDSDVKEGFTFNYKV